MPRSHAEEAEVLFSALTGACSLPYGAKNIPQEVAWEAKHRAEKRQQKCAFVVVTAHLSFREILASRSNAPFKTEGDKTKDQCPIYLSHLMCFLFFFPSRGD